jgi:hypothetical protein
MTQVTGRQKFSELIGWVLLIVSLAVGLGMTILAPI